MSRTRMHLLSAGILLLCALAAAPAHAQSDTVRCSRRAGQIDSPMRIPLATLQAVDRIYFDPTLPDVLQEPGPPGQLIARIDTAVAVIDPGPNPGYLAPHAELRYSLLALRGNLLRLCALFEQDLLAVTLDPERTNVAQEIDSIMLAMASRASGRPLVDTLSIQTLRVLRTPLAFAEVATHEARAEQQRLQRSSTLLLLTQEYFSLRNRIEQLLREICGSRDVLLPLGRVPVQASYPPSQVCADLAELVPAGRAIMLTAFPEHLLAPGLLFTRARVVRGRFVSRLVGVQLFTGLQDTPAGVEISTGPTVRNVAFMAGIGVVGPSWRRIQPLEDLAFSGSVVYIRRSDLSLGLTYSTVQGFGVRAVYGLKPREGPPSVPPRPSGAAGGPDRER